MNDLKKARLALEEKGLNLALVSDGKLIFESRAPGVGGLLEAAEKLGEGARNSSLSDRVVGRAAALIAAYLDIKAVFGKIMSEGAIDVLRSYDVTYEHGEKVPFIENEKGKPCPFEKLVEGYADPEEAYEEIRSRVQDS